MARMTSAGPAAPTAAAFMAAGAGPGVRARRAARLMAAVLVPARAALAWAARVLRAAVWVVAPVEWAADPAVVWVDALAASAAWAAAEAMAAVVAAAADRPENLRGRNLRATVHRASPSFLFRLS